LWPAMTIDRLITGDFIARLLFRSGTPRASWLWRRRTALNASPMLLREGVRSARRAALAFHPPI